MFGRIGIHLSAWTACAVVEVRADIDGLEADLGEPVAEAARHHTVDGMGCRLRVAAPEEEEISVLGDVGIEVGRRHHLAHGLAAPDMLGAPVLPFPAVEIPHLDGIAAQEGEEAVRAAVAGAEVHCSRRACPPGRGPLQGRKFSRPASARRPPILPLHPTRCARSRLCPCSACSARLWGPSRRVSSG